MSVLWSRRVVFLGCHGVGESYFSAPLHTNTHGKFGIVFPCEHDVIGKWAEFLFSEQNGSVLHVQPTKCSMLAVHVLRKSTCMRLSPLS